MRNYLLSNWLFFLPWISQRQGKKSGYFCRSCIYTQLIIKIRHNCFMWSILINPVLLYWFFWKCHSTISQHRNILWGGYEQTISCSFKMSVSYIYALASAFIEALYVWKQTSTWSYFTWFGCKSNVILNMILMLVEIWVLLLKIHYFRLWLVPLLRPWHRWREEWAVTLHPSIKARCTQSVRHAIKFSCVT